MALAALCYNWCILMYLDLYVVHPGAFRYTPVCILWHPGTRTTLVSIWEVYTYRPLWYTFGEYMGALLLAPATPPPPSNYQGTAPHTPSVPPFSAQHLHNHSDWTSDPV